MLVRQVAASMQSLLRILKTLFQCSSEVETHWRGELSFTHTETLITVQWKKMVQKPEFVHSLTFFVDGKERMFFLGKYYEDMQINTVGSLMLKVEVLYRLRSFSELSCIEATANISTTTTIVTTTTNTTTTSIAPINNTSQSDNVIPLVVGAFAGGNV